ncbi:MAG: tetraacyldisaccharide 4'-kinase [Chitinivibrionales bacterium]|nr:tetraacyldisaccharide 4'-kinase [Chitinivibrionales bacterium]MBD3357335.1 tetraacyldisaccharide 4'-kinase [Chitinivibrionales bacterium]
MIPKPLGSSLVGTILSRIYGAGVAIRNRRYDRKRDAAVETGRPTISIGGIHAGGTGKTPVTHMVGNWLVNAGHEVAYLSRGYGRQSKETLIVEPGETTCWKAAGDEPTMLHELLPQTWLGIGAKRRHSARRLMVHLGPNAVFVLDDGFQHRTLKRDLDIVCLPSDPLYGSLIPAGYMREPVSSLQRAHILCIIGAKEQAKVLTERARELQRGFPSAAVYPLCQQAIGWIDAKTGQSVDMSQLHEPALMCGIARPERFISMVQRMGIKPKEMLVRPDHHAFGRKEIMSFAKRGHTCFLTTHKDICRLPSKNCVNGLDFCYLKVSPTFLEEGHEREFRERVLGVARPKVGKTR